MDCILLGISCGPFYFEFLFVDWWVFWDCKCVAGLLINWSS
jgi:hypothetical protein